MTRPLVHCHSKEQAQFILDKIARRLKGCGLELHPEKTRVVYCQDEDRKEKHAETAFDFLGFTFRQRLCRARSGKIFLNFLPAISKKALRAIKQRIRNLKLKSQVAGTLRELSVQLNPKIRGWLHYYGQFSRSSLDPVWKHVDLHLMKWAKRKYKKLERRNRGAYKWLKIIATRDPHLFAHWSLRSNAMV